MPATSLKNITVQTSVDTRGTVCPGPLMETLKALGTVSSGEIIEVLSADEETRQNMPKWCTDLGNEYLGTIEESGYFKVYIKKK